MFIPEKIKLGGHIITVEMVSPKEIHSSGEYHNFYHTIRIEKDIDSKESRIAEIFLHEILEAIKMKNNLEIDHVHLTVFSESLFQVLRDNKLDFSKVT